MKLKSIFKKDRIKSKMNDEMAQHEIEKHLKDAEKIIADKDKLEKFLNGLELKLKSVPGGDKLAKIPILISLIRAYTKKEYTDIPYKSILATTSTLIYFFIPTDFLPDFIPGIGYIDDGTVILTCLKMINADIEKYIKWRGKNKRE